MIDDLQMLSQEDLYKLLNVGKETLIMWRDLGILKPIKTGRSYMFSQESIKEFQRRFEGYDISNRINAIQSLKEITRKELESIKM